MKANDDIVGQTITNVFKWGDDYRIILSNGMIIGINRDADVNVNDANAIYPLDKWVTIKDDKIIRTPEAKID